MEVRSMTRAMLACQKQTLRQTGFTRYISATPVRSLNTSSSPAPTTNAADQGQQQQQPKPPHRPSTSFFQRRRTPSFRNNNNSNNSGADKLNSVTNLLDNMGIREQPSSLSRGPGANRFRAAAQDQAVGNQVTDLLRGSGRKWDPDAFNALRAASRQEIDEASKIELRLSPTIGRSIPVKAGGLGLALAQLNARVRQNRIASDKRKQRFHVRRGQLKKDLRSERWRKLFKASFKATVERCERLRRQGW